MDHKVLHTVLVTGGSLICAWTVTSSFIRHFITTYTVSRMRKLNGFIFEDNYSQEITSESTNSVEEDWKTWSSPKSYAPNCVGIYPHILDNTEGIAGFADLPIPRDSKLLVDIGGGKFDSSKLWLESKYPGMTVLVMDPFRRNRKHNEECQQLIVEKGGADVATSISVLNVIQNQSFRLKHCVSMYSLLKPGGVAYFKIWAGSWPLRGTGRGGIKNITIIFYITILLSSII